MSARVLVDATSLVHLCRKKGIQLLACDFDSTLISIHTGGMWGDGAKKLSEFFRPCFKQLLSAALSDDMNVAVVTYSSQPWLIKEVLKITLNKCDTTKVIIRGNTPDFMEKTRFSAMGKEDHIAYVINELYTKMKKVVHPQEVLLLDDDRENVELAIKFGHRAFEVKDNITLEDLQRFLKSLPDKPKES